MANLVISPFLLHWTNDIVQSFREVYRILIPDGFFIASYFASHTLQELRECLEKAELSKDGILAPHTSPLPTAGAIGDALTEAGFIMTSVQANTITIEYRDMFQLMHHLQGMGENNCIADRSRYVPFSTFQHANELYKKLYPSPQGGIVATFEIAYITGWSVCEKTKKVLYPKKPGVSLQDFFDSMPDPTS